MTRNTNTDFGMAVAEDNKSMQDHEWRNDSRKTKWAVDLDRKPSHVQILDNLPGGTKWTLGVDSGTKLVETLFVMEHKMPFPPKFLCYFYTKDAPAALAAGVLGMYTQNRAFMMTNSVGIGEEGCYCEVDDKYFYIKHFVDASSVGTAGNTQTFYGSDFKFRVRFELLNQRAYYKGGKGY